MKAFDYVVPESLDDVQDILAVHGGEAKVIAGGTDLVVALKQGLLKPKVLVSTKKVKELRGISCEQAGLVIGAAATLSQVEYSNFVKQKFPILSQAAGSVASYQIRNRATIGGNICLNSRCRYFNQSDSWKEAYPDCRKNGGGTCYVAKAGGRCYAVFAADTVPALIALDANVKVIGPQGERSLPLAEIYTGAGERTTALGSNEVISAITVPFEENRKAYFHKYQNRPSIDFAQVTLAVSAVRAGESWEDIRIVVGGVASGPFRGSEAEQLWQTMAGDGKIFPAKIADLAAEGVKVVNTFTGSGFFKKNVIRKLVRQAVESIVV